MPSHYHQPGGLLSPSAFPVPFDPRDPASRNPYDQIKGFATRKASEVAENPLSALLGAALQDPLMLADLSGASSAGRVKRESAGYGSLLGEPPIEVQGLPAGDISRQQLGIDNPAGMTGEMSPLSIGGMLKLAGKGFDQAIRNMERQTQDSGGTVLALNGTLDHVHLVSALSSTISVAHLVQQVKGVSSHFVNETLRPGVQFKWQGGYGAFSIGQWDLPRVIQYVRHQKEHHEANDLWVELEQVFEPTEMVASVSI